jgi:hypothetical protein
LGSDEGFAPVDEGLTNEASIGSPAARNNELGGAPTTESGPASPAPLAHAEMEAREELLEETAANNEGMPEADGGEARKAAAAGSRKVI